MLKLEAKIEAILFFEGESVSKKRLSEITGANTDELENALNTLESNLINRGLTLIRNSKEVMLATSPEIGPTIEKMAKDELSRELGKAGLETVAIILYKGPISRREIDYIRGVNSSFILRNLLARGLIERNENKSGSRGYSYQPTLELLTFLGIAKIEDLPSYSEILKELEEFSKKDIEGSLE